MVLCGAVSWSRVRVPPDLPAVVANVSHRPDTAHKIRPRCAVARHCCTIVLYTGKNLRSEKGKPVAQKVQVTLVDDLDESEAAETVLFGLDGRNYEIDLSTKNADALRQSLAQYVEKARRPARGAAARGAGVRAPGGRASTDREQNKAIREWAKREGLDVSDRGRISKEVVDQYHARAGR